MTDPNVVNQKTLSGTVGWVVEVYPFENEFPAHGDFEGYTTPNTGITLDASLGGSGLGSLLSSATGAGKAAIDSILNKEPSGEPSPTDISHGLTSLNISRNKSRPDAQCMFTAAGPLPKGMHIGSWVIINSVSGLDDGNGKGTPLSVTRFIGQIYDVQSSYSQASDGLMSLKSQIYVREWSWALLSQIEYHEYSILYHMAKTGAIAGIPANLLANLDLEDLPDPDVADAKTVAEKTRELLTDVFDPLEFIQVVLKFIGMIQQKDYLSGVNSKVSEGFVDELSQFATSAPAIPPAVMDRLGISGVDPSQAPFSAGFVTVATGVLANPVLNNGDWNGVFSSGLTVDSFSQKMKDEYESKAKPMKPTINALAAISQISMSAWELMNKYSDNAFHEVYTDMWYESKNKGEITARPVIVARDKPYTMSGMLDQGWVKDKDIFDIWTKYDNIPRVRIDNAAITSLKISNTAVNSPNYIRISTIPGVYKNKIADVAAGIVGTTRVTPEMRRFGGKSRVVTTVFLAFNTKDGPNTSGKESYMIKWFATLNDVFRSWYAYDYRMANASLGIKDHNAILSVGFNAQFTVGKYELVGHVEGYNINYTVGPDNTGTTNINVNLSRVVHVYDNKQGGNNLGFLNQNSFGDLLYSEPPVIFNLSSPSASSQLVPNIGAGIGVFEES